ncbi:MAG: zinc ABC transporter substrate-binding protein [Actinomycetota bacterium]|nr:zinc ABC transporter substrate-binding protein [Actinomycetota bacterium]
MGIASGCGAAGGPAAASGKLVVIAAESHWGSIAAQLGGDRVAVQSIVASPSTDPHDYEPTAADARSVAGARMAIVNGVGYDAWAARLLGASPSPGRVVLDVGRLVGVAAGGNPHRWYSPADVHRVIDAITADYRRLDPTHATYFAKRKARFEQVALAPYRRVIAGIRARYGGTPVGASESIFALLAPELGLRLITPKAFLNAVSEGTDPTARDKATVDRQIAARQIAVWVYNSQNAPPDIERLNAAARRAGIPIATVTETQTPANVTFQSWQVRQLRALAGALAKATGR